MATNDFLAADLEHERIVAGRHRVPDRIVENGAHRFAGDRAAGRVDHSVFGILEFTSQPQVFVGGHQVAFGFHQVALAELGSAVEDRARGYSGADVK